MTDDSTMVRIGPPSAAQPLFILAMDHRDSFGGTLFGVRGTPDAGQLAGMRSAKELIFAGARQVAEGTPGPGQLGILVDEQLGADVARQARKAGFVLAMPVETSGADRLTFEYGDDFAAHVEVFDPDWVKVLVRFNPADPAELRDAQTGALRRLHDWVTASRRRWMCELLVPPTREQLVAHDDQALYDETARPALTAQVIGSLTAAGVHPGIWKLKVTRPPRGRNWSWTPSGTPAPRPARPSCSAATRRSARWTTGCRSRRRCRATWASPSAAASGTSRLPTTWPGTRTGTPPKPASPGTTATSSSSPLRPTPPRSTPCEPGSEP